MATESAGNCPEQCDTHSTFILIITTLRHGS